MDKYELMRGQIVPIANRVPGIPRGVADIIDRSLAPLARDRYQNGGEFRYALEQVL